MKIGIISDIHSNIQALIAVMKEVEKIKIDKIICCGYIIGIGPNPEEAVQMLIKKKESLIAVRGNHEKYFTEGLPKEVHEDKRKMSFDEIQNHKWTQSKLSEETIKFIKKLHIEKNIEIENKKLYIVHYPENEDGKYKKYIKNPTIAENQDMFGEINADIFIYGHTHAYSVNNMENKWYINPGALGCPISNNIANAGILDISNEKVNFQHLRIKYEVEKTIEEIERIKFPMYKEILKIFYGKII